MSKLIYTIITTAILQIANFATGILVARLLGPTHRGELSQIIAWYGFLVPICLLGLDDAVVYFRSKGEDPSRVLSTALTCSAITIILALAACGVALKLKLSHLPHGAVLGAWVFLLYAPTYQLNQLFSSYFQASTNGWLWTIQRVAPGPLYVLFILVAAALGHASVLGIVTASLGSVAVTILAGFLSFIYSGGSLVRPNALEMWRFFRYGSPLVVQRLSIVSRDNLDRMILPFFISASVLGNYVIAATSAYLVFIVGMSIALVSFPATVRVTNAEDRVETAEAFLSGTVVITLLGVAVLMLIAGPLVTILFGRAYKDAVPLVPWFLVAGALQSIRMVFGSIFKAFARSGALAAVEAINSAIMFAVLIICAKPLGAFAGALAHIISASISCLIAAFLAYRLFGLSPLRMIIPDRKHILRVLAAGQALLKSGGERSR